MQNKKVQKKTGPDAAAGTGGYTGLVIGVAVIALIGGISLRFIDARIAVLDVADQLAAVSGNIAGEENGASQDSGEAPSTDLPAVDDFFNASPLAPGETETFETPSDNTTTAPAQPAATPASPAGLPAQAGPPNFVARSLVATPNVMHPNQPIRLTATVANTGGSIASNVSGSLINTTNNYAMGIHTGYTFEPGQVYEFWEENTYPYFATCTNGGANTFRFTIDPQNLIAESDETDNSIELTVTLQGC